MKNRSLKCVWTPVAQEPAESGQCHWPGCNEAGAYRAPRSRVALNSYHWFCIAHVREYNQGWNYYAGMSQSEVEAEIRADTAWRRPTWPLNGGAEAAIRVFTKPRIFVDGLGPIGPGSEEIGATGPGDETWLREASPVDRATADAMAVLDLRPPLNTERLKARYKELAKLHHPDTNGGDKTAEERIKQINHAYKMLLQTLHV